MVAVEGSLVVVGCVEESGASQHLGATAANKFLDRWKAGLSFLVQEKRRLVAMETLEEGMAGVRAG